MFFYNLIIAPIEMLVEWVFVFMTSRLPQIGVFGAVVGVSLIINFLALPLYNIADALQEKERKTSRQLEPRVKKIKQAFSGDERFMMLSTYYRQNDYHPLYVLRSSLSILIEIPFFIAAYHYLSNCEILSEASFWIFKDLGKPDELIKLGKFSVNVLPILMTLINLVSGAIYTKGCPLKEKVQLYGITFVFLILLYKSPSGLVVYWILNNIFSLLKNVVLKMKHPGRILHLCICSLLAVFTMLLIVTGSNSKFVYFLVLLTFILIVMPILIDGLEKYKNKIAVSEIDSKSLLSLFLFSCIGLCILVGLYLPASVIASSPIEFSYLGETASPLSYVKETFSFYLGFFVLWPVVIYFMFGDKVKSYEALILFFVFILSLICVFVLKFEYGDLSVSFELEKPAILKNYKLYYDLIIIGVIAVLLAVVYCLVKFKKLYIINIFSVILCFGLFTLGVQKIVSINKEFKQLENVDGEKPVSLEPIYQLSKTNQNVVVFFLDRAIGAFIPQIFNEFPNIKNDFEEFTFYRNTLSFSTGTVTAAPALLGGYEYTPEEINARETELLRKKHNEATLVMPLLFNTNGYEVTFSDPPWPNYKAKGDLSAFDAYPEINVFENNGKYLNTYLETKKIALENNKDKICRKQIKNFVILEILLPRLKSPFYMHCRSVNIPDNSVSPMAEDFLKEFATLYFLPQLTSYDSKKSNFLIIDNEATHNVNLAMSSDYEMCEDRDISSSEKHYQANVASLRQLGKWIHSLKENEVYDNTRIIIVSDHGRALENKSFENFTDATIPATYNPLLLVKDFNQKEGGISDEFMTNADTLFLATKDLNFKMKNPFTGKTLIQNKSNGVNIYQCMNSAADHIRTDKKLELDDKQAYQVKDNIFEPTNWTVLNNWKNQEK